MCTLHACHAALNHNYNPSSPKPAKRSRVGGRNLPVEAVVHLVELVLGGGLEGDEVVLVLDEGCLHPLVDAGEVGDLVGRLVGAVRDDDTGERRVDAGELEVGAHVRVVDVDDVRAAQEADVAVLDVGVGGEGRDDGGGDGGEGGAEGGAARHFVGRTRHARRRADCRRRRGAGEGQGGAGDKGHGGEGGLGRALGRERKVAGGGGW